MSSVYTLMDPQEVADEADDDVVFDAGEYNAENEEQRCPGCGNQFRGKSEKKRRQWLSLHIRLHTVQGDQMSQLVTFFRM